MSDRAHIIDIDSIVLTGADLRNPDRLNALIQAEVLRALEGMGLGAPTAIANNEKSIAGEVARTVMRSVQGGADNV